jgi:ribosomal protein L29
MAKKTTIYSDIKTKPEAELLKLVTDSRAKLRKMTFDLQAGKVKNVRKIKETKKTIARVLTALKASKTSK